MRRLTLPFIMLALCLAACGGDSSADLDGGVDVDAFVPETDSGAVPDARVDAGSDGGALPMALTEAVDTVQASMVVVDEAFDAIPVGTSSVGPAFLETDLTRVRLDAIVGEKGLIAIVGEKGIGTLSLPLSGAPIMVILRNLQSAIDGIARAEVGWMGTTDPAVTSLRDALSALRTDLAILRAELLTYFRDLVTATAGLGRADLEYDDIRHFHLTSEGVTTQALVEAEPGGGTATVRVDCTTAVTDLAIEVHDDESGAELLAVAGGGGLIDHELTVRAGEPTLLRVRVVPVTGVSRWQPCTLTVIGHRYWRGEPVTVDSSTLSSVGSAWNGAITSLDTELEGVRGRGTLDDELAADVVQRFAAEASIETAFWRTGDAGIESDDQELALASLRDVLAGMFADLIASPQLSGTTWAQVRAQLETMRSANETAIGILER